MPDSRHLDTCKGPIPLDRTCIVGVLNVTPDSFFDGGRYEAVDRAVARGFELQEAGADVLDIGGESTRPGSRPVEAPEELDRVLPVIERLAGELDIPISIDTYKCDVARQCVEAGAAMVNDVTALRGDHDMVGFVSKAGVPIVLMHALWPPETMQKSPEYVDVTEDVLSFLDSRARHAMAFGVKRDRIVLDPGMGFGKTLEHNLELLRNLPALTALGFPVLVGPSRKRFLGDITGRPAEERLWGTAGAVALCAAAGAHFVRVHDVNAMKDVTRVVDAVVWQV